MFAKLESLERKYEDLERQLSAPDVVSDQERFRKLSKTHSDLSDVVAAFREYKKIAQDLEDNQEMAQDPDPEIRELAQAETKALKEAQVELEARLKVLLLPKDPMDEKNIILEIRAGTGGDEAALFAADLFRMYNRFAEREGWRSELLDTNDTGIGGYKEVVFHLKGTGVYSQLKYESGVHRVQRIPVTEAGGRIHTSTATVAVLPEAEEVDVQVRTEDLKIDTYRASGAGGQYVNMTDSAVRITHMPTGLVVTCQDERSQLKNRVKAMQLLRARLYDQELQRQQAEMAAERKGQVGTGDRSERIRTYNYPQNRLTDHRIGFTLYKLDQVLDGDLYELVEALTMAEQAEKLKTLAP